MARHRQHANDLDLDGLARDLGRAAGSEKLSGEARSRLFSAVTQRAEPGPLAMLFMPIRRLALAAVLPALFVGVVLTGIATRAPNPGTTGTTGTTTVSAEKVGDEVVFMIANGGRTHRVTRSVTPDGFAGSTGGVSVRGEYRENIADGSNLVFYRID